MDIIDRIIDNFIDHFALPLTQEEKEAFIRAQRVVEGGQSHWAYSAAAYEHADRKRAIWSALRAGLSPREIAERVGVSKRWVNHIISTQTMPGSDLP